MIEFKPRKRAKGAGRKANYHDNPFASYLKDNQLTVFEFFDIAEQTLATDYPDLFPPPALSQLQRVQRGAIKPEQLNASTIIKLCVLIGATPNDFIKNPLEETGIW